MAASDRAEEKYQIQKILSQHDPNGDIAAKIVRCLAKDTLTLEELSGFDDKSLNQTIDSWNIKSFHRKPYIIHGLLTNGIKKLKDTYNRSNSDISYGKFNNNNNNNSHFGMMLEDSRTKLTPDINSKNNNNNECYQWYFMNEENSAV